MDASWSVGLLLRGDQNPAVLFCDDAHTILETHFTQEKQLPEGEREGHSALLKIIVKLLVTSAAIQGPRRDTEDVQGHDIDAQERRQYRLTISPGRGQA
jgi:hypothetical protein